MASNLIAMASNLREMASKLLHSLPTCMRQMRIDALYGSWKCGRSHMPSESASFWACFLVGGPFKRTFGDSYRSPRLFPLYFLRPSDGFLFRPLDHSFLRSFFFLSYKSSPVRLLTLPNRKKLVGERLLLIQSWQHLFFLFEPAKRCLFMSHSQPLVCQPLLFVQTHKE